MNSFYGGGGATRHGLMTREFPKAPNSAALQAGCRSDALPASTLHGSQSGANPGPSNPTGCHTSYAREQSPPEPITNDYAALSGGW